MAYQIEVHVTTLKKGSLIWEWRAVKPSGDQEAPYRFNTVEAAEKVLRVIREPWQSAEYRIVEVS